MTQTSTSLIGQTFGRLTVVAFSHVNDQRLRCWKCTCSCGGERTTTGRNLRTGIATSCGCRQRETLEANRSHAGNPTHGLSATAEYRCWAAMKTRCTNPLANTWPRYGGRGIRMCQRWQDSFTAFLADMGPKPSDAHSIDRIDNDGHYEPGNCRWVLDDVQARNKTGLRMIEFRGETLCLTDWAKRFGLKPMTIARRIEHGWSIEQALTTALRGASHGIA